MPLFRALVKNMAASYFDKKYLTVFPASTLFPHREMTLYCMYLPTGPPRGCGGPGAERFQRASDVITFSKDPYDVIIVNREKQCFTIYYALLHIIQADPAMKIYILR
jgi:hypothetical protein